MNLMVVDENEILVTVGNERCNITTHSDNEISCIPSQTGSGSADFVVCKTVFHTRLYSVLFVYRYRLGNTSTIRVQMVRMVWEYKFNTKRQ